MQPIRRDYNYYRTYDPWTGRYLESDPIGIAADLNTYIYGSGDPLKYIDPNGLNPAAKIAELVCELVADHVNDNRRDYDKRIWEIWRQWMDSLSQAHKSRIRGCLQNSSFDECERARCINTAMDDYLDQEEEYWNEYSEKRKQNPWQEIVCSPFPARNPRRGG